MSTDARLRIDWRSSLGAVAALVLAAVFAIKAVAMGLGTLKQPGPGLWPLLVATGTALAALSSIFAPFAAPADEEPPDYRRVAIGMASLVAYGLVFPLTGFLLPSFLLVVLWLRTLMKEPWSIVGAVLLLTVVLWAVFRFVLEVSLPDDILISWAGV
jgi:putative tricarboxylic transport membrane protein